MDKTREELREEILDEVHDYFHSNPKPSNYEITDFALEQIEAQTAALRTEIENLREERDAYREGLEHYADALNWNGRDLYAGDGQGSGWQEAREILDRYN